MKKILFVCANPREMDRAIRNISSWSKYVSMPRKNGLTAFNFEIDFISYDSVNFKSKIIGCEFETIFISRNTPTTNFDFQYIESRFKDIRYFNVENL